MNSTHINPKFKFDGNELYFLKYCNLVYQTRDPMGDFNLMYKTRDQAGFYNLMYTQEIKFYI